MLDWLQDLDPKGENLDSQSREILTLTRQKKPYLLLVLEFPEVPLDNNEAERALREYVVKRKISNGTRTLGGNSSLGNFSRPGRYLSQAGSELLPVHPRSHIPNLRDASTGYLDFAEVSTLSQLNSILSKFECSN